MDLGIEGRVALVTAGSRGLGRGVVDALASEGVRLVVAAHGEEPLAEVASTLQSAGVEVATVAADVTDPEVPGGLVELAVERFGSLDIVVANAGGPPAGRALEVDDAALTAVLNANLLTSVRLVRSAVPVMARRDGVASAVSPPTRWYSPFRPWRCPTRPGSALWAWAKTAAHDLAVDGTGITLNLACPGPHATERMRELGNDGRGPMGDPADFGKVVTFLCSDPARFVNGAAVVVDGGATLAL